MNDYDEIERTSSFGYRGQKIFHSVLAEAAAISYRTFESIQALVGTMYCKGVQIEALRKFAVEAGCWFSDISTLGVFSDRGSENEVYSSFNSEPLFKLNDFRYADDNLNTLTYQYGWRGRGRRGGHQYKENTLSKRRTRPRDL